MNFASALHLFHILWAVPTFLLSRGAPNTSQFKVQSLPGSPTLSPSWAGRLAVPGTVNGNSMFFWLFETENLIYDDNLIIWFNGGPGCSSLIGLTTGNGPISFSGNSTRLERNQYSWSNLGHVLYVDQPVGTGFSTASDPDPVRNNKETTDDFVQWLHAFLAYFPHLQSKKIHLMGESYAGIYVPYFAQALLDGSYPLSLNIKSMSLGDGSWGNAAAMSSVAMGTYMRSQAERLEVSNDLLSAFSIADRKCGFKKVLQEANIYPPRGKIHIPGDPESLNYRRLQSRDVNPDILAGSCDINPNTTAEVEASIFNSTCYGPCATFSTALDYMATISEQGTGPSCYDVYDISHDCSTIDPLPLLASYFSRKDVQSALHVSNSGDYSPCNSDILATLLDAASPVPPEYSILPSLVTDHNVSLHFYNGELDMLINHIGTELSIQNMTWNGAQGFSEKPSWLFYADDASPSLTKQSSAKTTSKPVGIWNAERGVSYHMFNGAGHSVFATKQKEMFAFVRDIVVGGKVD